MKSIEERLVDIEQRLALLEAGSKVVAPAATEQSEVPRVGMTAGQLIRLVVSNKRYAPSNPSLGTYEDHIWFDCSYTLSTDSKPTRAVKGLLEFADLFGDVQFRLNATLNEPLSPGRTLDQPGIGFAYNQFMGEHQWMMVTALTDMKVSFRPMSILFSDGKSESFI